MAADRDVFRLEEEIHGRDARDALLPEEHPNRLARFWSAGWPKLVAVVAFFTIWQVIVWTHWKPEFALPGPNIVLPELGRLVKTADCWTGTVARTMRRAVTGFTLSVVIGTALGIAISRNKIMRRALGSFITGLQSMPSIAWFPLAILVFGTSESAILFVVLLGASPSVANGVVSGVDHIPPLLLRAGRVMGAHGISSLRHVVLPAGLPTYVAGLKQGWAFMWRSLLAGELLSDIGGRASIGARMQNARDLSDAAGLIAVMIVIFTIGVLVDGLVFSAIERSIRRRRGLVEVGAAA
jgi:NitT/TauT family transport system permease protein